MIEFIQANGWVVDIGLMGLGFVAGCAVTLAAWKDEGRRRMLRWDWAAKDGEFTAYPDAGPPPKKPHNCLEDPNCYPGKTMGKPMGNKPRIKGD